MIYDIEQGEGKRVILLQALTAPKKKTDFIKLFPVYHRYQQYKENTYNTLLMYLMLGNATQELCTLSPHWPAERRLSYIAWVIARQTAVYYEDGVRKVGSCKFQHDNIMAHLLAINMGSAGIKLAGVISKEWYGKHPDPDELPRMIRPHEVIGQCLAAVMELKKAWKDADKNQMKKLMNRWQ
ncbi:MAG: hypothetical protein D6746_11180 [Bacteroidetes bacterium]|nr:MAG: hypothetical protein D6746_11180 [Bacteroidota bacterium]